MIKLNSEELGDWRWLTSETADPYLRLAAEHRGSLQQLIGRLRQSLPPSAARLVSQQFELRQRAAVKFTNAAKLLFAGKLLEQATDQAIASYKASRFPQGAQVHDICCGIGGDLMALLRRGPVVGIDRDPIAILLANHNVQAIGPLEHEATFREMSLDQATAAELQTDWLHIDPDRRPDKLKSGGKQQRVTAWKYLVPSPNVLNLLRRRTKGLAVKVAPATVAPDDWHDCQREWIGSRGECRQQVVWCGELAKSTHRTATVIDPHDGVWHLEEVVDSSLATAEHFGQFLIEPHSAVLAADLSASLAEHYSAKSAAPAGGYLTGSKPVTCPLAASFEVLDRAPLDARKVRKVLQGHNVTHLVVKRRGIKDTPDNILKRLKWKNPPLRDTGPFVHTLIVTRLGNQVMTALCRRLEQNA